MPSLRGSACERRPACHLLIQLMEVQKMQQMHTYRAFQSRSSATPFRHWLLASAPFPAALPPVAGACIGRPGVLKVQMVSQMERTAMHGMRQALAAW